MKKRLFAVLLALCLVVSLMPTSAIAYVGGMHYLDLSADTYADNDFIYLENSSLRFMIERDYGHGMLLWTSDEVVGWGQGVQEMRFTIQYPDQDEREMNVTRLEQRYGQGTIWLIYHFGNDHYKTPGDVEITYEAEITLVPLDSGAATGITGQYIDYNADGKNNWGVLIKGEFEYDSDSVRFNTFEELGLRGATARVYTTYEGFPNMGHEAYQYEPAPVSVMLSSYTYDDNYYSDGKIHTATNISRGLGMTSTHIDDSGYGGITEIYTSGYSWASPFIATSNFYHKNTGWADLGQYSEENPEGIAGYPDRNENLGVDDQIYDTRDKRGRSLNLPSYVSYSPGDTSGECVVTTVSEAIGLGYELYGGVVNDSDMASLLYGYRNLVDTSTTNTPPSDRDDVNVSADADRLAIWYEGENVRVEPVLGESDVPSNAVAVFRGTFEETDDGAGYRFMNGVAALSPTVTAAWTGYEGSNWSLIVNKNGTISVGEYVSLNAPSFKFYQASDRNVEGKQLKLEVTKDGIKMTMAPDNNSAVPYVDIPNATVKLESGIIKRDGGLEFSGKLGFNNFFTNSDLDLKRLAYGYSGSQFTIFGVEATGDIQKTELAGLELGSVSGDINTFNGNNTFNFNAELDVFSLFKAQAELNFSRMDNGELMPDDIYFNIDSKVGIPITPPAPLAKLKGGGAGIYNLATTINGDWFAIPPILLRGTVSTEIINLLTGTANATLGPSQIELVGSDIKIKALGNMKVIEEAGVGVYLGAQTIDGYTGGSFNGEVWLRAGLPSVGMNFIKMDNALSLGVFGGVNSSGTQALLRVTGNAKSDVEIQFPDSWPVIGGWNLLGAELNAAAGAQTVMPFTGSVGSIFEESFNNLDIYLGVAATASLLGSEGRVWVLLPDVVNDSREGVNWGYDYKLAGELPEWSWEGIVPYSATSSNGGGEPALLSDPAPANSAATDVRVSGVTGEQSGYIVLTFDESVTEEQLKSGLSVSKNGGGEVSLVWPEWETDDDGDQAIKNGGEMTVVSRIGTNKTSNEKERVVMVYVGEGDAANGTYTVNLPDGVAQVNGSYDATVSPLDKLSSSISASISSQNGTGTITSGVVNPEQDATYIVRTYLGEEIGGADYLLDERTVTDADLSDGELGFTIDVTLNGAAAPSGTYYPTIFLMRQETVTGEDGTEQKVLVAIDSKGVSGTTFTYTNSNAPDAHGSVTLTAIGNENMTAGWSGVSGADGYRITIYNADGTDTGLGYEYDAEQFESSSENHISGLKAEGNTYSIDMAMTVGGASSEEGAAVTLQAGKDYIVGISAYKSAEITTGGETQTANYYGSETKSNAAYLPEYKGLELSIMYDRYPLTANDDGMYTHSIREIDNGKLLEIDVINPVSNGDYQFTVSRTDTGDVIHSSNSSSFPSVDFHGLVDFVGALPLKIEAKVTYTENGVKVTDTTVKYLTILLDDVPPIITLDQDVFLADANGNVTVTGVTEPGAGIVTISSNDASFEDAKADENGRFTITTNIKTGCAIIVTAYDYANNTGTDTGFVAPQPEAPDLPDTPDPDPGVPSTPTEPDGPEDDGLPFTDVKTRDWFYDSVVYVYENGLMDGVSGTLFDPDGTVTRAQLVTMLWRLDGEPSVNYALPFTDVSVGEWYAEAVRWAAGEGIVNGVSETEFAPNAAVTREQLAAILHRYAQHKGYDVSIGESTNILSYSDFASISEYAISAMQWVCGEGIITGVTESTLEPQGTATRAQSAAILMRFIENVSK